MFRTSYLVFLFLFIFSLALPANSVPVEGFKTPNVLTVCSYSKFKPVSYGCGDGYEADLLRAIAKLWHVKIRFYSEPIYEGIWRQPSRKYTACDIAMGGISPMAYRQKQGAVFSTATMRFKQSLLVRMKDYQQGLIRSYNDFKNGKRTIGVVPGTTGELFAHQRAEDAGVPLSVFKQYESESDLMPALKQGEIDAIARGELGNEYQASINPEVKVIDKKDFGEAFAFVVNPTNSGLLRHVNQAIEKVTNHGKIGFFSWLKNRDVFLQRVKKLEQCKCPLKC